MVSKEFEKLFAKAHPELPNLELALKEHELELQEFRERHERHLRKKQEAPPAKKAS